MMSGLSHNPVLQDACQIRAEDADLEFENYLWQKMDWNVVKLLYFRGE